MWLAATVGLFRCASADRRYADSSLRQAWKELRHVRTSSRSFQTRCNVRGDDMTWHHMTWRKNSGEETRRDDKTRHDPTWRDMTRQDTTRKRWHDLTRTEMTWRHVTRQWRDVTWRDATMTWRGVTWCDGTWHDRISLMRYSDLFFTSFS